MKHFEAVHNIKYSLPIARMHIEVFEKSAHCFGCVPYILTKSIDELLFVADHCTTSRKRTTALDWLFMRIS